MPSRDDPMTVLAGRMLRPRGIAVLGASEQPASLGTRYLRGLIRHGFAGPIYPVNPKYQSVMGLPCYPTIADVPDPCDTAVLSIRAELVEPALIECADRGLAQNPPSFRTCIEIVCRSRACGVAVLCITVQGPELARTMAETIAATPEALSGRLLVMWYAGAMSNDARRFLRAQGVTVFDTPRALAVAIDASRHWGQLTADQ